ncbi:hypothetical protein NMY22_g14116 [Coprinellus aureogranulatus]|nr:hypothetical protein NMY22_g14116 [Coprinellus aureogranulatus]
MQESEELSDALKQETILSAAAHDDAPFEQVLQNWKDGKYPQNPAASTAFVILSDPLSSAYEGLKGLKGADAQLSNHILPIARKLGFTRWADDLEAYKTGNFDVESFDMGAIEKEVYKPEAMRDITSCDGSAPFRGQAGIVVNKNAIIPKNAIELARLREARLTQKKASSLTNERGSTKKGKNSAGKRKAVSKTPSGAAASGSNPAALAAEVEGSRPFKRSRVD